MKSQGMMMDRSGMRKMDEGAQSPMKEMVLVHMESFSWEEAFFLLGGSWTKFINEYLSPLMQWSAYQGITARTSLQQALLNIMYIPRLLRQGSLIVEGHDIRWPIILWVEDVRILHGCQRLGGGCQAIALVSIAVGMCRDATRLSMPCRIAQLDVLVAPNF